MMKPVSNVTWPNWKKIGDLHRLFQTILRERAKQKKIFFRSRQNVLRETSSLAQETGRTTQFLFPSLAVRSDNTHIYGDDARRMQRYLLRVLCACTTRRTRRTRKCVSLSAFGSRTARARIDPTIRTSARRDVLGTR